MLEELREKRRKLAAEIKGYANRWNQAKSEWASSDDEAGWQKLNADYDANLRALEAAEAQEKRSREVSERLAALDEYDRRSVNHGGVVPGLEDERPRNVRSDGPAPLTDELAGLALAGWLRGENRSERQDLAMRRFGLRGGALTLNLPNTADCRALQRRFREVHHSRSVDHCLENPRESRALSAVDGSTGGVTIGTTLVRTLEVNMLAFGGVRQVAETITTDTGEEMAWPTADDTSNTGQMLGESTSIGSSVDPSFTAVRWGAYKFSSKPILVPHELLEDSVVNLPVVLGQMLGERLGRITNTRFTTGTGGAQPTGIVTAGSSGVTAASATAITADEIIGLIHSIDPAYRALGCGFMCHDSILLHIRRLKDGDGRYLMDFGLTQGMPDTILSYPVTNNQDMQSSVATGTFTLLFGHLSSYKIRRVRQIRMYRLQERYRDTDQEGFVAFVREDGNLLTSGTGRVKYITQA